MKGVEDKGGRVREGGVSDGSLGDFVMVIEVERKEWKGLIENV